jgi:hypothetical protein
MQPDPTLSVDELSTRAIGIDAPGPRIEARRPRNARIRDSSDRAPSPRCTAASAACAEW